MGSEHPAAFDQRLIDLARELADRFVMTLQGARLYEQVRSGKERLALLSRQLIRTQEDERRRISRELHDEVGQDLAASKVNLQALQRSAADLASVIQETTATVDNTMQQVKRISLDLRPSILDDLGLAAALRSHLDRQAQRSGIAIQFDVEPIVDRMSPEIETACFRVAQEAMTNIVRHAMPSRVRVELRLCQTDIELLVHDDGVGFDVGAARERALHGGESLGILGREERVALVGGRIRIESAPDRGTEIRVRFPLLLAS